MTQARTPAGTGVGTGAGEYIVDTNQYPTALSWTQTVGQPNHMDNVDQFTATIATDSSGEVARWVATGNGRVDGITIHNGAVAHTGANGWELDVKNEDRSDAVVGHFGVGTGTNASSASDSTTVDSNTTVHIGNSQSAVTSFFTYGDVLTVDATEDGTAGAMDVTVHVVLGDQGWAAS